MSKLWIIEPIAIASVSASRGTIAENLLTRSPKEVWADGATGTATLTVDLGLARPIDTIFLGHVRPPVAGATWAITGGLAGAGETVTGSPAVPARVGSLASA